MEFDWSISSEVAANQFLDLLASPFQSISENGEVALTAETIVI